MRFLQENCRVIKTSLEMPANSANLLKARDHPDSVRSFKQLSQLRFYVSAFGSEQFLPR
jgi:hypothetical protein